MDAVPVQERGIEWYRTSQSGEKRYRVRWRENGRHRESGAPPRATTSGRPCPREQSRTSESGLNCEWISSWATTAWIPRAIADCSKTEAGPTRTPPALISPLPSSAQAKASRLASCDPAGPTLGSRCRSPLCKGRSPSPFYSRARTTSLTQRQAPGLRSPVSIRSWSRTTGKCRGAALAPPFW